MAWRRAKPAGTPVRRPARHGRHGRVGRSPIVRPPLPPIDTRIERFDLAVGAAAEFLRSAWDELRDVSFEIGDMPGETGDRGIPRWTVDTTARRIIVWRLPIERLSHLHRDDDLHRRMMIESCVFRAAAEYLDMDPWDLGPERFRYF
ncbi:metallopeptidase family protein [Microbacterium xanthum]|uniref:metallopeptidase family protein n=1 Tax=Microbacterium xanthum TaxID=3079794 RepID=UPI002AD38B56|nr:MULTISPECIES: metallopeptidase family protein [unclassified Microbacterium]MDZ8171077.1 metallopeptidase family protein [Microbacterium sp. KSW-48]MDZ8201594.1 metallopeptidase family protein [Microbacterium sp. SSW1-59]